MDTALILQHPALSQTSDLFDDRLWRWHTLEFLGFDPRGMEFDGRQRMARGSTRHAARRCSPTPSRGSGRNRAARCGAGPRTLGFLDRSVWHGANACGLRVAGGSTRDAVTVPVGARSRSEGRRAFARQRQTVCRTLGQGQLPSDVE